MFSWSLPWVIMTVVSCHDTSGSEIILRSEVHLRSLGSHIGSHCCKPVVLGRPSALRFWADTEVLP